MTERGNPVLDAIHARRSVLSSTDEPVPEEVLRSLACRQAGIVDAGRTAPSGGSLRIGLDKALSFDR